MSIEKGLIVFCKTVVPGKVKTRLAVTVGDDKAAQIYASLLEKTQKTALALDATRFAYLSPNVEYWPGFESRLQVGDDLGQRMQTAIEEVLEEHPKAVLIGGDIAQLTPDVLAKAFTELDAADVVIGPAADGGYYLIGMTEAHPELFAEMSWSNDQVAATTIARAEKKGLLVVQLKTLSDIDYWEDWVQYGWDLPGINRK